MIEATESKQQHPASASRAAGSYLWIAFLFTAVPLICLAVPMYVIRPFRPQDFSQLTAALTIRSLGPWLSALSAIVVFIITVRAWRRSKRILPRLVSAALSLVVIVGACLTNVNIFEVMFHPYGSAAFTDSASAQVDPDDKVIAITIGDEARAYPIRTMGYHHIVNDTVGGTPLAVTYCTLCHTGLVWSRTLNGRTLHFRLAGINNGNALMRDEETSSIWQQSTGEAIFGPLRGQHLALIHSDELTFALWRAEQPKGLVLRPDAQYAADYDPKDWERHVEKTRTVIDTSKSGIGPHELMLGVTVSDLNKAYRMKSVLAAKLIQDQIGNVPILVLVGPDAASIRIFKGTLNTSPATFTSSESKGSIMQDAETRSDWNFEGCAIAGKLTGQCLSPLDGHKDYWFDWLNHHPGTLVYRG